MPPGNKPLLELIWPGSMSLCCVTMLHGFDNLLTAWQLGMVITNEYAPKWEMVNRNFFSMVYELTAMGHGIASMLL